jgi:hypothetical protein
LSGSFFSLDPGPLNSRSSDSWFSLWLSQSRALAGSSLFLGFDEGRGRDEAVGGFRRRLDGLLGVLPAGREEVEDEALARPREPGPRGLLNGKGSSSESVSERRRRSDMGGRKESPFLRGRPGLFLGERWP